MPIFLDTAAEWTIRRLLTWAAERFAASGIDSPRLTAEILLAHSLHIPRVRLFTDPDHPLSDADCHRFDILMRRRMDWEPVAYITGTKEFWGLGLQVTPDVLVPRPDTEHLVDAVLKVLPESDRHGRWRIADLGTGSGAIAVALGSERPRHHYVAVDRSLAALQIARENARRHGVDRIINFLLGDWLEAFSDRRRPFNIIVSNPPYIRTDELSELAPDIRLHEPSCALDGGADGLGAFRCILARACRCLLPGGFLFLEMGYRQRQELQAMACDVGGFDDIRCLPDYAGHDRVLRLQVSGRQPALS